MSVAFYFKNDELFVSADGSSVSMEDYSNQVWNDCVSELMPFGIQKDTLDKCAVNYGRRISELKQYAIPFGKLGIKIIREITKVATNHLMFVMVETDRLSKQKKRKSGFATVTKSI